MNDASQTATTSTIDPILSVADLNALGITFNPRFLIRRERAGTFPKRVRLGDRRYGWVQSEIAQWLEAKKAERTTN